MQTKYLSLLCLLALALGAHAQSDQQQAAADANQQQAAADANQQQAAAQSDTAQIDRTVYVTRDFQPTVESAGKISVKPTIYEPKIEPVEPQYSSFSSPLALDYTMNKLDFSVLNFRQPQPLNGYLQAGIGHANTLFLFNYRITDAAMQKKKTAANDLSIDIHAGHDGQWGYKALSQTSLGMDLQKTFNKTELYFGAHGAHEYFSRYGHYFDTATLAYEPAKLHLKDMGYDYKQNAWTADANIGVKSAPGAEMQYQAEVGYDAFILPDYGTEHQVHTMGMFEYKINYHHVGANLDIRNRFYSTTHPALASLTRTNHRIHLEPYYAYDGKVLRAHAGLNLDFSIGRGKVPGISPNLSIQADLAKNWLAAYATARGNYAANGIRGEYLENRYRPVSCLFVDTLSSEYTPVDIEVGFLIRPYNTLLLNIHAGYELAYDKHVNVFLLDHETDIVGMDTYGLFEHELQNVSVWKVGMDLHYHFRDIVHLDAGGNYYAHKALINSDPFGLGREAFDTPSWRVDIRLDGKINQKWSLYSDNHLAGGVHAVTYTKELDERVSNTRHPGDDPTAALDLGYRSVRLRPMFDLNLGVQYRIDKWLSVYAQLNNYLAFAPKLRYSTFYGYEAQGANCMFGVSYSFK